MSDGVFTNNIFLPLPDSAGVGSSNASLNIWGWKDIGGGAGEKRSLVEMRLPMSGAGGSSNVLVQCPENTTIQVNASVANVHYDVVSVGSNVTMNKTTTYLNTPEINVPSVSLIPNTILEYEIYWARHGAGRVMFDDYGNTYILVNTGTIYNLDGTPSAVASPNGAGKKVVKYRADGTAQYAIPLNLSTHVEVHGKKVVVSDYHPGTPMMLNNLDGSATGVVFDAEYGAVYYVVYDSNDGKMLWYTGGVQSDYGLGIPSWYFDLPPRVVAFDKFGNMIVTMKTYFSNPGQSKIIRIKNPDGTDAFSFTMPGSSPGSSTLVVKYDPSGTPMWYVDFSNANLMLDIEPGDVTVNANGETILNGMVVTSYGVNEIRNPADNSVLVAGIPTRTSWNPTNVIFKISSSGLVVNAFMVATADALAQGSGWLEVREVNFDSANVCGIVGKYTHLPLSIPLKNFDGSLSTVSLPPTSQYTDFFALYDSQGRVKWAMTAPQLHPALVDDRVIMGIGCYTYSASTQTFDFMSDRVVTSYTLDTLTLPAGGQGERKFALAELSLADGSLVGYQYLPENVDHLQRARYVKATGVYHLPMELAGSSALFFAHVDDQTKTVSVDTLVGGVTFPAVVVNFDMVPVAIDRYALSVSGIATDGYCKTLVNPMRTLTRVEIGSDGVEEEVTVPPKSSVQIVYNAQLARWIPLLEHVDTDRILNKSVTSAKLDDVVTVKELVVARSVKPASTDTVDLGDTNRRFMDAYFNGTVYGRVMTSSDARLKSDLTRIDDALEKVKRLTGYTYAMEKHADRQAGLIAQDVREVLPEAVQHVGESEFLSVSYGGVASLLVEAVKQLSQQVEEIRARLT